jgi:hypothetical protein
MGGEPMSESNNNSSKAAGGFSLGSVIAIVFSCVRWGLTWWVIPHAIFSWAYVLYSLIKYGWPF